MRDFIVTFKGWYGTPCLTVKVTAEDRNAAERIARRDNPQHKVILTIEDARPRLTNAQLYGRDGCRALGLRPARIA